MSAFQSEKLGFYLLKPEATQIWANGTGNAAREA